MTELRARGWRTLLAHPLVLGGLLALLAVNVTTVRPAFGVDSSFRVGLTEAVAYLGYDFHEIRMLSISTTSDCAIFTGFTVIPSRRNGRARGR